MVWAPSCALMDAGDTPEAKRPRSSPATCVPLNRLVAGAALLAAAVLGSHRAYARTTISRAGRPSVRARPFKPDRRTSAPTFLRSELAMAPPSRDAATQPLLG